MPLLLHWSDLPAELSPTVARQRLVGKHATLVRVQIEAGTKAGRHSHDHEQFVQVLVGSGRLETEEGCQPFEAGSLFHFPADTWHAAEFDTDTVLVETNLLSSDQHAG